MATIAEIIQNNQWHSSDIRESTYVNKLFNSGVIRDGGDMAQAAINALEFDNVQSVVKTGLMDYAWHEQHLGDASDSEVAGVEIDLETVHDVMHSRRRHIHGGDFAITHVAFFLTCIINHLRAKIVITVTDCNGSFR
jgi:hypothetical protein